MRNAARAREPNTERSRKAADSAPQDRVTVIRKMQKIRDHTTRLATISTAPAGISAKKYSGSRPHNPYAPKPNRTPAVVSLSTALRPDGAVAAVLGKELVSGGVGTYTFTPVVGL